MRLPVRLLPGREQEGFGLFLADDFGVQPVLFPEAKMFVVPETKGSFQIFRRRVYRSGDVDAGVVAADFPAYILNPPPTVISKHPED